MYSEINPPPQLPSMTKTKHDDSWYYSDRKIALIDARYDRRDNNNQPSTR